ncbi:cytochrome P450 [Cenococcum geophilum]
MAGRMVRRFGFDSLKGLAHSHHGASQPASPAIASFTARGLTPADAADEALVRLRIPSPPLPSPPHYIHPTNPPTSLAGFDSIATALRHTLLRILSSPTAHARLLAELRTLPHPPDPTVSETTINHLPYLRAFILESLRLFPLLTPYLLKRCLAAGATLPDGTRIPGGIEAVVSFVALRRDRSVYGEDVGCFRPERGVME